MDTRTALRLKCSALVSIAAAEIHKLTLESYGRILFRGTHPAGLGGNCEMKKCPFCAEEIQDDAIKCRYCGEVLTDKEVDGAPATTGGSPLLKFLGALLFLGGLAVAIYYFAYFDTSIPVPKTLILGHVIGGGRVNNVGLMQQRQDGLIASIAVSLVGFLIVAFAGRMGKSD